MIQNALASGPIKRVADLLSSEKVGFWFQWLFAAYTLISVASNALAGIRRELSGDLGVQSWSLLQSDTIDRPLIFAGIQSKPTFLSTFSWYHQTWAGIVPFWRPLTSQLFWIEYHVFTPERFIYAQVVTAVSHLLFAALLALLTYRLTGRVWLATLSALIFEGAIDLPPWSWFVNSIGPATQFPFDTASDCIQNWKDQPEVWTAACTFSAMLLALNGRWAWSLASAAVAICFKESGWYVFLLVPLALLAVGKFRSIPRWTYFAGAALAAILLILRFSAGKAVFLGYHEGHVVNWLARYLAPVEGPYFIALQTATPSAALATALFTLYLWRKANFWVRFLLGLLAIAECSELAALFYHESAAVGLTMLLVWDIGLGHVVNSFVWLFLVSVIFRSKDYRLMACAVAGMVLVSGASMAAASQVTGHVLYLTYALQSVLAAITCGAVVQWVSAASQKVRCYPSSSEAPAPGAM